MRRRGFFALGLGMMACAAGCGTESNLGSSAANAARVLGRFAIVPGGGRWARVARALVETARGAGFPVSGTLPATRITVTGLPALAATELNHGLSLLDTATPLARLTGQIEVVVVPADSKFATFDQFGAHLLAYPDRPPLAGGPPGEPDHLLFGLIAQGLGADARQRRLQRLTPAARRPRPRCSAAGPPRPSARFARLAHGHRQGQGPGRWPSPAPSGWTVSTRRACGSAGCGSTSPTGARRSGPRGWPRRNGLRRRLCDEVDGVRRLAGGVPRGRDGP